MSLPKFFTNLQPVEWTSVNLTGNVNTSQKYVTMSAVKNQTVDDVSDGTGPVASLELPDMKDYSITVKTSELLDYTVSVDKNNAAKIEDETHVTKIKAKSTLKEGLLGAIVVNDDQTITWYTNPLQALTECDDKSKIQLVSYDCYIDSSWNSTPLAAFLTKQKS